MDTNEQNQQDKRELRHKRRQRNQIIAYTVVGIMILLLAVGIAFAVSKITSMSRNQEEQQNKVDEILSDEETIQAPTESQETVVELTDEQKLDTIINEAIIQNMPLEDKVAGLFITTPESITGVSAAVQAGRRYQGCVIPIPGRWNRIRCEKHPVCRSAEADDR